VNTYDTYIFIIYSLGRDPVIKGLEEGLLGMREGGKRRLLIPSALGYKSKQQLPIPRSFANRQRLYSTVLNTERTVREREALGADIAGVHKFEVSEVFVDTVVFTVNIP
jgi:FKBP-type peptidyl-prolyl cis-trans isomerase 2